MIYSPQDIIIVLGVALLIFGPKRLPELGKAIGQGLGNFKKSMSDAESVARAEIETATSLPVSGELGLPSNTEARSGKDANR
jgi:sec-independent protein translocase protein TatA